jgi:hypothetical protein
MIRSPQSRADEVALAAYFSLRASGEAHQRALSVAILSLIKDGEAADGREARARVITLLRSRGVIPTDREDWIMTAATSEAWRGGARAAVERLSAECRRPFPKLAPGGEDGVELDLIGAGMVAAYLRSQMPVRVARLRRDVMRLFAAPANSPW